LVNYTKASDPVTIICSAHGEFQQLPQTHLQGKGCKKCGLTRGFNTDTFIEKAKKIHGERYDYSLAEYQKSDVPITIICSVHGEFEQTPQTHLSGSNCMKCARYNSETTESFIAKAKEKHGDKYDYSNTTYFGSSFNIAVVCKTHGEFQQLPSGHLKSVVACPKCRDASKITTESFIVKAKALHGNRYDYSLSVYTKWDQYVIITCPVHGNFNQTPCNHLNGGGCSKCGVAKAESTESFIEKARAIHGDRYEYSDTKYTGAQKQVNIICRVHGEFKQLATNHLSGKGCIDCRNDSNTSTLEDFLKKAKAKHGDVYTYDNAEYNGSSNHITITCKKHGDFDQIVYTHLRGAGCNLCFQEKRCVSQELARSVFEEMFEEKFVICKPWWLQGMELDGYNEANHIAFEYQGEQHERYVPFFHRDENAFKDQQSRDILKKELCKKHHVDLICIPSKYKTKPQIIKYVEMKLSKLGYPIV
jgi:predicted acyltransferase (DUF342 family)